MNNVLALTIAFAVMAIITGVSAHVIVTLVSKLMNKLYFDGWSIFSILVIILVSINLIMVIVYYVHVIRYVYDKLV